MGMVIIEWFYIIIYCTIIIIVDFVQIFIDIGTFCFYCPTTFHIDLKLLILLTTVTYYIN